MNNILTKGNKQLDAKKIHCLTSLRFFAASAIVFLHSRPFFEITSGRLTNWPLHYGVTFFFVLSGFILTYVYQDIPPGRRRDFYISRIARIWPAHVASLILLPFLLPSVQWIWEGANPLLVTITNVLLMQAIIPIPEYYFSYNGVAWSISTEIFFYAAFPFLLLNWSSTWLWKLACSLLLALLVVLASDYLALPPFSPSVFLKVTSHGMVYISPVVRIFEFMLGMVAAKIAIRNGIGIDKRRPLLPWTLAELGTLILALYVAAMLSNLPSRFGATKETALVTWIIHSSGAIFFALMIAVMSFQGGLLSRLLRLEL
ncbi:peptidoglycan/LPS O-acetylase OafA/YrhL [Methylocaldum sp. RMAD-M]|nr:peptidoglycan/LPS O-acetylase OafA/YrhL [Methylocaldum sp. RMAD-M]